MISKIKNIFSKKREKVNNLVEVRNSNIHNKGIFATRDIPKGKKVIEYVGKKITKKEADDIYEKNLEKHKKDKSHGAVYIFELNKKWDIDGDVDWNPAKYINHSCDPNCETDIKEDRIWIISIKPIKKGEEILYNYGYDIDNFKDHPCQCGSEKCIGYILHEDKWPKLKKLLEKKKTKK